VAAAAVHLVAAVAVAAHLAVVAEEAVLQAAVAADHRVAAVEGTVLQEGEAEEDDLNASCFESSINKKALALRGQRFCDLVKNGSLLNH
jgi:hypothetical protein